MDARPALLWEIEIPLLWNRFFLYDAVKPLAGAFFLMTGFLLVTNTGWMMTLKFVGACFAAVLVLLAISMPMLGNRRHFRYLLSPLGMGYEVVNGRGKATGNLAIIAGLLAGNAGVVGAGLLSRARESGMVPWEKVRQVKAYSREGEISVMNGWRVIARLFCPPEIYPNALEYVHRLAPGARILVDGR